MVQNGNDKAKSVDLLKKKNKQKIIDKNKKKSTRKPKPKKINSENAKLEKKFAGSHAEKMESVLAAKVFKSNKKLQILKPNNKVIEEFELKENKRRKRG